MLAIERKRIYHIIIIREHVQIHRYYIYTYTFTAYTKLIGVTVIYYIILAQFAEFRFTRV